MITFKPIIIPGGRRKDGTWPVKIRVTFRGVSRRLPTTLACTDADLTRGGRIKNATILQKAGELITRMRATCDGLSPFTLEQWDVDAVVDHIRRSLSAESFRLDFLAYGRKVAAGKAYHTRLYYLTALNALERFVGRPSLDVNDVTRRLLQDFAAEVGEVKAARHLAKLAYIYRTAQEEFNDEDTGVIPIPRHPFQNKPKIQPQGKGQKALPAETIQRLLDATPANEWEVIALAAFFLSFCTMGANLADLYAQKGPILSVWTYNRRKTGVHAEVALNRKAEAFARVLGAGRGNGGGWWLPELHRYCSADAATHNVNKWLRVIAEREGLEPFTFYAARKTWGTLARRLGVEKATVDDALAHIGDFKMADIYAEKNWSLTWAANEKVQALFRWPEVSDNNGTKTAKKRSRGPLPGSKPFSPFPYDGETITGGKGSDLF